MTTTQQIDYLKIKGHHFAAGALARTMSHPREYGCHFGLRSELTAARAQFGRGWDAANIEETRK
jgi:hypothetical protein